MQKRKSGCLKIFVFTILVIVIIFVIANGIENHKFNKWYTNFKDCPLPVGSVLIKTDKEQGKIDNGNRESDDYGVYWVIETALNKEEVTAYYDKIVFEANKNVIGYDSYLFVHIIPDNDYFFFDNISEYMDSFDPSQYSQNVFIVYVIKPGRHFLRN